MERSGTEIASQELEKALTDARELLRQVNGSSTHAARQQLGQAAESLLMEYVSSDSPRASTAKTLLLAAQAIQGEPSSRAIELDQIQLGDVETPDLLLAASVMFGAGNFAASDHLVTEAVRRDDHREQVLRQAILVRYDLGRDDEVLKYARELSKLAPQDPNPWLVMAMVFKNRGQWNNVVDAYRQMIERTPVEARAPLEARLVYHLTTTGNAEEARNKFDDLKSKAPAVLDADPLIEARLLHLEGSSEAALALAQQALKQKLNDSETLLLISRIRLSRSQPQKVIDAMKELLESEPGNNEAYYLLGQAYAQSGDSQQAKKYLELHQELRAINIRINELERRAGRDSTDVAVRKELASSYEKIGIPQLKEFWERAAAAAEGQ
jgi:tetratricopeptide (TPR) repeat protein